jgi:hypothetical protein
MLPSTTCKIYNEINYINSATKMKIHYMVQQMPCECTRNHSIIFLFILNIIASTTLYQYTIINMFKISRGVFIK